MDTFELKCFGAGAGEGNTALVVLGDTSDEAARLAFARTRGLPACVFVDFGAGADARAGANAGAASAAGATGADAASPITLDYYYPHTRSPLCLHATLAAARVLLDGQPGPLTVRTAMRGQELQLSLRDGVAYASLRRQAAPEVAILAELPARLLSLAGVAGTAHTTGAPGVALASAPAIASVGSPKLLLEVADSAALHALQPDLAAIADWGKVSGVSGVYAWCRRPDGALEGRNFNHLDPKLEDAATGVAAGALTVLLGHPIELYQGANMGQPCLLRTTIEGENVLVGGAAELASGAAN